jgi:hypothetical protein
MTNLQSKLTVALRLDTVMTVALRQDRVHLGHTDESARNNIISHRSANYPHVYNDNSKDSDIIR